MSVEIVVPQIGEAVSELVLTNWLKSEGDRVAKGDVLFEIDSDKAIVEVEAFVDGTLVEILSPDGSTVMPRQVVARLQPLVEGVESQSTSAMQDGNHDKTQKISPVARRLAADLGVNLEQVNGSGPGGRITADDVRKQSNHHAPQRAPAARINASPKARSLARDLQLELSTLTGTGVDGMIRVKDVESAVAQRPDTTINPPVPSDRQPLTRLRQIIAERTSLSKQTIPHFYLMADVNMTQVNHLRAYCRDKLGWQRPPSYTDVMVRACALALADVPEVNQHYIDHSLIINNSISIGVAIHNDHGLVAPTINNVDKMDLQETSQALQNLVTRAREGRLKADDTGQKSMVISNLGMYSVDAFVAIIDMPDPMILAVGQVAERVIPMNGQIMIQPMCTLTLSVDHRALDGVPAARFLERIKDHLENPFEILIANS